MKGKEEMASKTTSDSRRVEETDQFEKGCAHHWVIEPPRGPVSKGICIKCGAEKEFNNWGKVEK